MSVKTSVGKGFGIARQSMPVVGILSLFSFVWNLINLYYAPQVQQNPQAAISAVLVVATIVFLLVSIYLQAGTLGYIRDKVKQGQATLSVFTSSAGQYYMRIFGVGLIITSIALLFIVVAAVLVAFLKTVGVVIAVAVAVIGIYLFCLVLFAPYIIVANDERAVASIKKSVGLVKKNILPVFGISLILVVVAFAVGLLTGVLLGLVNVAAPGPVSRVIYALVSSLLNSFLGVFVYASFMNFYFEVSNR